MVQSSSFPDIILVILAVENICSNSIAVVIVMVIKRFAATALYFVVAPAGCCCYCRCVRSYISRKSPVCADWQIS